MQFKRLTLQDKNNIFNLISGRINTDRNTEKKEGIVTRGHGNRFIVFSDNEYIPCQLRGIVKHKTSHSTPVAVGDNVLISLIDDGEGVIEEILPRKSVLSRPVTGRESHEHVIAANVDSLIIVTSIKQPLLKSGLIDRFLIAAQVGQLHPVIVINKIDLGPEPHINEIIETYRDLGFDLFLTSANEEKTKPENELNLFGKYLNNHKSILAGHSGVGKSSLLNLLIPGLNLPTSSISKSTNRGRHATSWMELIQLPGGGFVIDSPGVKVLGLWQVEKENILKYYPEMMDFQGECRFMPCTHTHEPDCAIKKAVESGKIMKFRYRNYLQIYESLES
ncbi:MAG: ribosome small subunit-dependent GTPase A [Candidatus Zixiibacteriota bacterium]